MPSDGNIRARGKTARDRHNGKPARNSANKLARANWERSRKSSNLPFPVETCNGKRHRKAVKNARRKD